MPLTRLAEVVDGLVSVLSAALPDVAVLDGVPVTYERLDRVLVVGGSVDERDRPTAGTFSQSVHDMGGGGTRDEFGTVRCEARVQSGGDDYRQVRADALAIAGTVGDVLRADPSLGVDRLLRAEVSAAELLAGRTAHGVVATVELTIAYTALI